MKLLSSPYHMAADTKTCQVFFAKDKALYTMSFANTDKEQKIDGMYRNLSCKRPMVKLVP